MFGGGFSASNEKLKIKGHGCLKSAFLNVDDEIEAGGIGPKLSAISGRSLRVLGILGTNSRRTGIRIAST